MSTFLDFKKGMQSKFDSITKNQDKLYITDLPKDELWDTYLDSFPAGTNEIYRERRKYDCNCCKTFIRNMGQSVVINSDLEIETMWDIPGLTSPFKEVAKAMSDLIKAREIKDLFLTKDKKQGTDRNIDNTEDIMWNHFYLELPSKFVSGKNDELPAILGQTRDSKHVFERSMRELTLSSGEMILELIQQNSIYRGLEFKSSIREFIKLKTQFDAVKDCDKSNWCWKTSASSSISRIRNSAIGTFLINLSDGMDLTVAVKKFEDVVAPQNYKRTTALYTKSMVDAAEKQVMELGYGNSLGRRLAVLNDITVNNVIHANRSAKANMSSPFDALKESIVHNPKQFDRLDEISIDDFISNVVPTATSLEVLLENRHQGNLMTLVAPEDSEAPSMLKWDNNFSWAYNGDVADSMKQRVKDAGGKTEGVLRYTIQWNDGDNNQNDFDAHCYEPNGNVIMFHNKGRVQRSSGMLDVDIVRPRDTIAVENIIYTDLNKMPLGDYRFVVHNYSHNGGKTGFTAELEFDGAIQSFAYDKELKQGEFVEVAVVRLTPQGFTIIKSLDANVSTKSKKIWGVNTNTFVKVSTLMLSPNYWDNQKATGNKHWFFMLEGCRTDIAPRGFFNEFLDNKLTPHRKVFEMLGSKMKVRLDEDQLSGVGFSSTITNTVVVRVEGKTKRLLKIKF